MGRTAPLSSPFFFLTLQIKNKWKEKTRGKPGRKKRKNCKIFGIDKTKTEICLTDFLALGIYRGATQAWCHPNIVGYTRKKNCSRQLRKKKKMRGYFGGGGFCFKVGGVSIRGTDNQKGVRRRRLGWEENQKEWRTKGRESFVPYAWRAAHRG